LKNGFGKNGNISILKDKNGPVYLDELAEDRGNMDTEIFPDCGIMCYLAEKK